jgi:hypothetical protein
VVDTVGKASRRHGIGHKFPIIGHKDLKGSIKLHHNMFVPVLLSPPRPGTNWADWSDVMGREMYLRRALDRLNFEYPPDNASE